MPRLRLLLAVPLLLAFAPAPKRKEGDDAKRLQGDWKVVHVEHSGKAGPEVMRAWDKVVITAGRLEFHYVGTSSDKLSYAVDPKKKVKEITLTPVPGPGAPPPAGRPWPGIYLLEKDALTICFSAGGRGPRPKEFATRPGDGNSLLVLHRVKP